MTEFAVARRNMVESQIRPNSVTDRRLIAALLEVPRERFVPASMRELAYIDEDIRLTEAVHGPGMRWLMEPMPFARLVQLAEIAPTDIVLDVGCATGYSTAVLARLAESVVGLECDSTLSARAESLLVEQGVANAAVVTGDLADGYPGQGPYDVIVLEGAIDDVPRALFAQLRDGGRLVAAIRQGPIGKATLYRSVGGIVSSWTAFDVNVRPLPGFEKSPAFTF